MMRRADARVPLSIYPTTLCDYTAGMHLAQAVLAAIISMMKTGKGQCIEVSLYDSMIAMQMQEAACQLNTGKEINWAEMPLTGVFETTDGAFVLVGAFKENPLRDICNVIEIEDLSETYPDYEAQRDNKAYLQDRFKEKFLENTTAFWVNRLESADLLCAPILELSDTLENEQTAVNEMITTIDHPINGPMKIIASPLHFSDIPFEVRRTPPKHGEHTQEILKEIGLHNT